jgi:hypothetical protein
MPQKDEPQSILCKAAIVISILQFDFFVDLIHKILI